jgi:hypothetical protein
MAATALAIAKKKKPALNALRAAANRVLDLGTTSGTVVFLTRGLRALTRLAEAMPAEALTEAATADSDYAVLVAALEKPTALAELQRHDPLAEVRLRGLHERQRLLAAEGGVLSGEEAAQLLGISRQAVDKRRGLGRLLAIRVGPHRFVYPAWQFHADGVLPGWEAVLADLRPHDPWMQVAFMLSGNTGLERKSPLDLLRRGQIAAVRRVARLYGEHGSV